tara:strand:+ start:330 stop:890 length:561 start_codon:yes stop_codon:yes gene_type:complete
MRHSISGRKLNRTSSHRKSLFKNLSNSLIINEQIKTTLPKAKDLKPFVEKIITLGKKDTLHSKRKVFSILRSNQSVNKVFNVLSKRYKSRNGGYTRVIKAGFRYGDASPMAIIEFVERDVEAKGLLDKNRLANENETKKDFEQETLKTKSEEKNKTDLKKKQNFDKKSQESSDKIRTETSKEDKKK